MTDTAADKAEAAAIRRRWINLREIVAVGGLLIAAASLWLSWQSQRTSEAEKHAERAASSRYEVAATVASNGDLLIVRDPAHPLSEMRVTFPSALGIAPYNAPAQTIELSRYRDALMRATDGQADRQTGRLPVLLSVDYWDGDARKTTQGIYDIVWKTNGRPLFGRALHIEGMTLRARGGTPAQLDRMWPGPQPKS